VNDKQRHTTHRAVLAVLFLLGAVALGAVAPTLARSGGGYDLSWWTADGGGQTFGSGGGYSLGGTAGQPDAGLMSGGGYSLAGGFWGGGMAAGPRYYLYLPLAMRNH
jgi:hypothetical protein